MTEPQQQEGVETATAAQLADNQAKQVSFQAIVADTLVGRQTEDSAAAKLKVAAANDEGNEEDSSVFLGGDNQATAAKEDGADGADGADGEAGEESEYEMVEEEGEDEIEEIADQAATDAAENMDDEKKDAENADPTTMQPKKKKKMVRRKKKKVPSKEAAEAEVKVKEKGVQMPPWTEALEIEYMNQDQLKKVIAKLREDGLSEEDIKLGEDLYYKRAAFQMDKFVKMCEVREIVSQALNSILNSMKKADDLARKNRSQITKIEDKVNAQKQEITKLKRLDNSQNTLIKMQKDQEIKLQELNANIADWKYEAHVKGEEREQIHEEMHREITRLKSATEQLDSRTQYISDKQFEAHEHLNQFTEEVKETMEKKISNLEDQIKQMPQVIQQQVLLVEKMKEEVSLKASQQFQEICSTLKVDTSRILEVEEKIKEQTKMQKSLQMLNIEVVKLKKFEDDIFQSHCFIERTLPMMIHHQVCEAVNIVSGPNLPELMAFEKRKTDEVWEHFKLCEGIKPDIKKFRNCIEKFTECAWKFKIGAAPFTYGENRDYWAEITPKFYQNYDKRLYQTTRHLPIEQKLREVDDERKSDMEAHINYLFSTERDNTKALIQQHISTVRQTPTSMVKQMTKTPIQPQPTMKASLKNVEAPVKIVKTTESNTASRRSKKPSSRNLNNLNNSRTASRHVSKVNVMPLEDEVVPIKIENQGPDLKSEQMSMREAEEDEVKSEDVAEAALSGDQSMTQSQLMLNSSRGPQEIKMVTNVKVVHKVDSAALNKLKQQCSKFMAQGRTEFNRQLGKWQEFFDETHDDHFQMESRLEKLETLVNILTDNLEDMQARSPYLDPVTDATGNTAGGKNGLERQPNIIKNRQRAFTMKQKSGNMSLSGQPNQLGSITEECNAENDDKQSRQDDSFSTSAKDEVSEKQITIRQSTLRSTDSGDQALVKALDQTAPKVITSNASALRKPSVAASENIGIRKQVTIIDKPVEFANGTNQQQQQQPESPDRGRRLSKLEDTQRMLNNQTASCARRVTLQPPRATQHTGNTTSTFTEDSVSSLNTVEKLQNAEAEQKVAGNGFNFAKEFQRNTMSRHELTLFVQKKYEELFERTEQTISQAEKRYADILHEKIQIKNQNKEFQTDVLNDQTAFTEKTNDYMKQKGLEVQQMLLERININEGHVQDFEERLKQNERVLEQLAERIRQEYQDFANNRKRWKSDFAMATNKAVQNMEKIRDMLSGCENQNQINTNAIKLILDAQMIEQIVQRQDVEDRKRLLILAQKKDQELLQTDHGVHAREICGPKNVHKKDLKHDRARSYTQQQSGSAMGKGTQTGGKQPNQNNKVVVPSAQKQQNTQANNDDHIKEFADNACRVDPPILKVDRHCMNCSNNKALTLNAIKVACLTHTQSAIPYQGKNYHISDILDVKAKVVAQCQRMLRENLFQTKNNAGIGIREQDNEKSFIITPLANTKPVRVETNIEDMMNGQMQQMNFLDALGGPDRGSILCNGSPTHNQSQEEQSSARPRQDSMFARYQTHGGGSPMNVPADDSVLEIEGEKMLEENNYRSRQDATNRDEMQILSSQQNVSTGNDDLFSSNNNLTNNQSIQIALKNNRGTSQLTHHKNDNSAAFGRANFGHIRFSSSSRIHHNNGKQQVSEILDANNSVRRSLFDQKAFSGQNYNQATAQNDQANGTAAALPDVQPQRGAYPQKFGNLDFEHMFESSQGVLSTKNSHVRQSSVLSGTTTQNLFVQSNKQHGGGMSSTRYTANRIGQSVLEGESNYRATDGFKNLQMKKLSQKKHSELVNGNRPQTQENTAAGFGVKRINSFRNN